MVDSDQIYNTLKDTKNHLLRLVKNVGELNGSVESLQRELQGVKDAQEGFGIAHTQLTSMIRDRMTPDRCAHVHDDLSLRIKEEVKNEVKAEIGTETKEAIKGWARVTMQVLKIGIYIAGIFGGSAWGVNQAMEVIKKIGDGS